MNGHVGNQFATFAEFDLWTNDAIGANFARGRDTRSRIDNRGGMNERIGIRRRIINAGRSHSKF
jgi:hypothetical protein